MNGDDAQGISDGTIGSVKSGTHQKYSLVGPSFDTTLSPPVASPSAFTLSKTNTHTATTTGMEDEVVLPLRGGRQLCVRHKQMANQNINAKLQKVRRESLLPLAPHPLSMELSEHSLTAEP